MRKKVTVVTLLAIAIGMPVAAYFVQSIWVVIAGAGLIALLLPFVKYKPALVDADSLLWWGWDKR